MLPATTYHVNYACKRNSAEAPQPDQHSHEYMPLLSDIYPDYAKRGLPKRFAPPLTPQQLHNAYRHSLDKTIPFKCDLIERLVPIILQDSPGFFN